MSEKSALVIDDHPITHLGCNRILGDLGYAPVLKAMSGAEAKEALRSHQPGLIVLDINLPEGSGLGLLPQLLAAAPGVQVLVFSMNDQPGFAARAIQAGARGFLSKNAPPEDFTAAVRTLEGGGLWLDPQQALEALSQGAADPLAQLSDREREVLRLLGRGSSLQATAEALGLSYKTVANTSSVLKKKLGLGGMSELIRFAIEAEPPLR